jgi:two-component system, sensor histidine kinase and response regulator
LIRRALAGGSEPGFVESDRDRRETRPNAAPLARASRGLRILLVEDNAVNQRVAAAQLGKLGYDVDVAGNGIEALDALGRQRYDLVFMDCQMPGMDGFQATRAIRAREGDGRRTPIVAMTANALKGGREACLAVGMDDYLSKPVLAEDLRRALATWLPADGLRAGDGIPAVETKPALRARRECEPDVLPSLDADVLAGLRALEAATEPGLLQEVLSTFQAAVPERLQALREIGSPGDVRALGPVAHSLKGSCGIVGARRMAARCAALEQAAKAGDAETCARTLAALEHDWHSALQELAPYLASQSLSTIASQSVSTIASPSARTAS